MRVTARRRRAPDKPVAEAASLMLCHHTGGLPVVGDDEAVVGIITETDIFRFIDLAERQS